MNVKVDLELDRSSVTTAATETSKKAEEIVSSRFSETGLEASNNGVTLNRVVRVPASQSDRDLVASPDSISDPTRMDSSCASGQKPDPTVVSSVSLVSLHPVFIT